MEIEQLQKRLDWLDEERRKDKATIASLQERINALENVQAVSGKLAQDLSGDVTHLRTMLAKIDQFEGSLSQLRLETNRTVEEIERVRKDREQEVEELRRVQAETMLKQLNDIRKELEQLPSIHSQIALRVDEEARLNRKLDEIKSQIDEFKRQDEEVTRSIRLIEEGRRRDEKRQADLQGETLALRKRADEQRGKLDLTSEMLRKVENRLSEISTVEVERREAYNSFVEKQTLAQVERDRKWTEWQSRFETIEKQAMEVEARVQELHTVQRDVRQAYENIETLSERVERRIHEITEMQRLDEDRFRQELATFKADDQKRWTNYTLTQDEASREASRGLARIVERMTALEELAQTLDDQLVQINIQTENRLQRLLALARDLAADYERVFGPAAR